MSFLRLQLLPAQLLWWRKLRCSWLPILCLEGRVCCASVLQCSSSSCHPLTSHWCCLPLPLPWRRAGLVAEPLLCCWRPSTLRISVPLLPLLRVRLVGQAKKEISTFQGRKIRVNFFLSGGITQPRECCTATVSCCSAMAAQYMTLLK